MEQLPVEVIGYILSRLGTARDVVVESVTCRKWQKARRNYLHSLSFDSNIWPGNNKLTMRRFETLITRTIFQTDGLQCLSIVNFEGNDFAAPTVMAWLVYTRKTLRQLHFDGSSTPDINIIEECARGNLEDLKLVNGSITGVDHVYLNFPFLHSLSLFRCSISALDLSLLVSACPKLVKLALEYLDIAMSDA